MHIADYAVARCLFVCPFVCHTPVLCQLKTAEHILKLVSPAGSHTIIVFSTPNNMATFMGASNTKGIWTKIAIFDQYLAISRKWYRIQPQLLWNANRKPYLMFRRYHFQWPRTTPNPYFKVTLSFNAECLRNRTRYGHSYNGILIQTYALFISNELDWPWMTYEKYSMTRNIAVSLCDSRVASKNKYSRYISPAFNHSLYLV